MEHEPPVAPVVETSRTRVWVVVSDCGLNGPAIHGVYTSEPSWENVERFVMSARVIDGFHVRVASVTGYQNTQVLEMELDGELK